MTYFLILELFSVTEVCFLVYKMPDLQKREGGNVAYLSISLCNLILLKLPTFIPRPFPIPNR